MYLVGRTSLVQCDEEMMTQIGCIQLIGLLTSLMSAYVGLIISFSQLLEVPSFGWKDFQAEIS